MAVVTLPPIDSDGQAPTLVEDVRDDDAGSDPFSETLDEGDLYQRPKPAPPEWIEAVLQAHNHKRGMHWTPPLIWSELCYEYAKRQADTCMHSSKMKHGLNDTIQGRLGQCLLGPKDGGPWRMNRKGVAEKIVEHWYKEIAHYRMDVPGHHEKSANFEQVMWFGTTSVGLALSKDGKYVVANYYPAGPDSLLEPPGEKGRRNYFPGGQPVLDLTNQDKYRFWFKTNILPRKDGPAPWLGGVDRPNSPDSSGSPGRSPGGSSGRRAGSPKDKRKMKRGHSRKSLKSPNSRPGSRKSLSPGSSRKSTPAPGQSRKSMSRESQKNTVKLMKPNSPTRKSVSPGSKGDKRPTSKGRKSTPSR